MKNLVGVYTLQGVEFYKELKTMHEIIDLEDYVRDFIDKSVENFEYINQELLALEERISYALEYKDYQALTELKEQLFKWERL